MIEQHFQAAIAAAGLTHPNNITADGKIHRFSSSGKPRDEAGWYVLHLDGIPAGGFGCWRTGLTQTWCSRSPDTLTAAEQQAHRARIQAMQAARDAEQAQRHQQASKAAASRWDKATPATEHPYLTTKGIKPHGIRTEGGNLLVPMRDTSGKLHSLQVIDAEGIKRFLSGGRVSGCYFGIGKPDGVLIVCEGFATGASIHECTGHAVAVAFNAGNLKAVAVALRAKHPELKLIIAADDDHQTNGNPGLTKAREAAKEVGALLWVPTFGTDRPSDATDFNDMAKLHGIEAVRASFDGLAISAAPEPVAQTFAPPGADEWSPDLVAAAEAAQAVPEPPPLLKPVSVGDVLTDPAPPPAFVWQDYLPRGVVALFGAHGGTGKSTCALMLAVAVVTGRALFNVPTEQSPVVFVSLEDGANIVRHRLAGICRAWGIDPPSLADRLHIVDGTENPELFEADQRGAGNVTAAYVELSRLVENTRAGLVVVDNASDSFGGDEINRRQVRGFMRALVQVARLTDCAVCLLAHVDKNTSRNTKPQNGEGYSGSTAWHNSARSRLFMTRDDSGLLTLEHQKSNLGKRREPVTLQWPDGGLPMLAGDAPNFDGLNARAEGRADDEKAAALLALLAEFESREQYASPAPQARNNVHALLRMEPAFLRLKLNRDATARIVNQCQRAGWIEPLEYKSAHTRKHCQRWTVTQQGRNFAGLPAPTAPTCTHMDVSAQGEEDANVGAPTAPTCGRGYGGIAHPHVGADVGAEEGDSLAGADDVPVPAGDDGEVM